MQRTGYLELAGEAVFATLHEGERRTDTGVLFCPAFGWEELDSHRTLMRLAEALAADGHLALRLDLPASGDSPGGACDPGRLQSSREALAAAAEHMRSMLGVARVVAFGMGLGGMLALAALAGGAPIDDLALWAVPGRGIRLLRELRAFSGAIDGLDLFDPVAAPDDGSSEFAGFVLANDAVAWLQALDLTTQALPPSARRRVLLIGRHGLGPDRELGEQLERNGVELTAERGPSYGAMMGEPVDAQETDGLLERTCEWIGAPATAPVHGVAATRSPQREELVLAELGVRETPIELVLNGETMRGIVSRPLERELELCAVVLNSGAARRIGLGRVSVELARRWAARGIPTVRFDLLGIGDSDGPRDPFRAELDSIYRDHVGAQVTQALAQLANTDLPAGYLLVGQCSGGYWAYHASLADTRVRATVVINPPRLKWTGAALTRRPLDVTAYLRKVLVRLAHGELREVIRDARERKRIQRIANTGVRHLRVLLLPWIWSPRVRLRREFARLHKRGVTTNLVVGRDEPVEADIAVSLRPDGNEPWPGVVVERLDFRDHTIIPVAHQRAMHEALDRVLERTLLELQA